MILMRISVNRDSFVTFGGVEGCRPFFFVAVLPSFQLHRILERYGILKMKRVEVLIRTGVKI